MNILLLESELRQIGGSEAMAFAVARGLADRGHSVYLVYKEEGPVVIENRASFQGMEHVPLQPFGWRSLGASLMTVLALWRLTRRWKIDVVFSSHLGFLRTFALLRTVSGVPFVYHLGLGPPRANQSVNWAIGKLGAGIAPSPVTAHQWREGGLASERTHIVPNWVDFGRFNLGTNKALNREKTGLKIDGPLIVFVGRVVPPKGIEMLLRAFSRVISRQPKATLAIVGNVDSNYVPKVTALRAELGLSDDRLKMVGFTKDPQLYFAAADIVVVPSIWEEPFGLTAIEGMASGALTLVSSAGALPSVMGDENRDLVFPMGDAEALAQKMEDWISRPEDAVRRGLQLCDYVQKNFQAADKIERYEAIMLALTKR